MDGVSVTMTSSVHNARDGGDSGDGDVGSALHDQGGGGDRLNCVGPAQRAAGSEPHEALQSPKAPIEQQHTQNEDTFCHGSELL